MTLLEKIQKKAERYKDTIPIFIEDANSPFENQWISVENDLPCNHKELLDCDNETTLVIVKDKYSIDVDYMRLYENSWTWVLYRGVTHWFPIPELSNKIGNITTERKIGELFEIDGVKLICLQDKSTTPACKNCYFYYKKEKPCSQILCAEYEREDATNVYFEEIKE